MLVINQKAAKKTTKAPVITPEDPHAVVRAAFEAGCAVESKSTTASGPYPTWYSDGEPNIELRFIGGKLHSVRKI